MIAGLASTLSRYRSICVRDQATAGKQVRVLARHMDMFSAEFLNIARRHFLK